MMNDQSDRFVVVGNVRRPHGVRGEVSVEVATDNAERFRPGSILCLRGEAGSRQTVQVDSSRPHHGQLLVHFAGVEDRDQAALLRGATLEVEEERVPRPPAGSYYYYELVGCDCREITTGRIGEVSEVVEDGGGLLLSVDSDAGTILIPFVDNFIRRIDLEEKLIELELPAGLLELCISPS